MQSDNQNNLLSSEPVSSELETSWNDGRKKALAAFADHHSGAEIKIVMFCIGGWIGPNDVLMHLDPGLGVLDVNVSHESTAEESPWHFAFNQAGDILEMHSCPSERQRSDEAAMAKKAASRAIDNNNVSD